ncbi:flagellar FliJ family protein [Arthrobacter sp.]|uniref:flagellar FliJ family protein n=1 Tax=Arthrobacter sp. TaxID=1667 RepID=UPI0033997858
MARSFPLAGLLRLRQLQQDQAAGNLAAANNRARESGARVVAARNELGETISEVSDAATLHAVAAARSASRSMLADLENLDRTRQHEAQQAQQEFLAVRKQSVGLEKLETRHLEAEAVEELRREQLVLDELSIGARGGDGR